MYLGLLILHADRVVHQFFQSLESLLKMVEKSGVS